MTRAGRMPIAYAAVPQRVECARFGTGIVATLPISFPSRRLARWWLAREGGLFIVAGFVGPGIGGAILDGMVESLPHPLLRITAKALSIGGCAAVAILAAGEVRLRAVRPVELRVDSDELYSARLGVRHRRRPARGRL